jgi:hypothetical protein
MTRYLLTAHWVSIRWQWSVNLYANRKNELYIREEQYTKQYKNQKIEKKKETNKTKHKKI